MPTYAPNLHTVCLSEQFIKCKGEIKVLTQMCAYIKHLLTLRLSCDLELWDWDVGLAHIMCSTLDQRRFKIR